MAPSLAHLTLADPGLIPHLKAGVWHHDSGFWADVKVLATTGSPLGALKGVWSSLVLVIREAGRCGVLPGLSWGDCGRWGAEGRLQTSVLGWGGRRQTPSTQNLLPPGISWETGLGAGWPRLSDF